MRTRLFVLAVVPLASCFDDDHTHLPEPPALLDPASIPKFAMPLTLPVAMPPESATDERVEYRIAVRQVSQQMLPPPLPATTVYAYGREGDPATFTTPGPTIETRSNQPVRVTWINQLVDDAGDFLPPLLPIDATLHWADPGGAQMHDHRDDRGETALYTGPVPIVIHVHGAHSFDHSDGYPEAWYLPDAGDIPEGFARQGRAFQSQADAGPGAAVFDYPQDENATTLWYHDHVLGMTRINIYSGLAGFWLIRDEHEDALGLPGPAPRAGDPPGTRYYEIPLAIADRNFGEDGSLSYPTSRSQYDGYTGPFIPDSEVSPIWGPEFIGNTIIVNGQTWPYLEVEPRMYRLRLLNASDARTLIMAFDRAGLHFVQIGTDGGFVPNAPLIRNQILLGPAERVDVLVDFSTFTPGETITLLNAGPDEPWGGPDADPPQDPADPATTGQIMQFRVVPLTNGGARGAPPISLPALPSLSPTVPPRDLVLSELDTPDNFPVHVRLGTVALGPLPWAAPTTEVIRLDATEMWRVANTTDDAHPIHLHLVEFQVLDRLPFDADAFSAAQEAWLARTGPEPRLEDFVTGDPMPGEFGAKDTVMMLPGTITRLVARFDRAGRYVWHCHITEHEDNDMMRPLEIVP